MRRSPPYHDERPVIGSRAMDRRSRTSTGTASTAHLIRQCTKALLVLAVLSMSMYLYAVHQFLRIPTPMLDNGNPWRIVMPVRSTTTANNNGFMTRPLPTEAQTPLSKTRPRLECGNHHHDENDDPEDLELLDKEMQEMVYWWDIPSDALAFPASHPTTKPKQKQKQYLSFEPEDAGWNNKRMSFEMALVLAHAMDRTLVLPPKRIISHFHLVENTTVPIVSFEDFFDLDTLNDTYAGVDIVTFQDFLIRESLTGHLVDVETNQTIFPEHNRTNWNNDYFVVKKKILRKASIMPIWYTEACIVPFASDGNHSKWQTILSNSLFQNRRRNRRRRPVRDDHQNEMPVPVDAPPLDRWNEILAGRRTICLYNNEMKRTKLIHFRLDAPRLTVRETEQKNCRILSHFYASIFFEDWKHALWTKRLVRDRLRYRDTYMCTAARVVNALRNRARQRDPTGNAKGLFHAFHIRRTDFSTQFPGADESAETIYQHTKDLFQNYKNATVFIATDAPDRSFFRPLSDAYDVVFLNSFESLLGDLNPNMYHVIDQLVASRADIFIGTYYSTLTNYINRLRGYYSTKHELPGYENGSIRSYYFSPQHGAKRDEMFHYRAPSPPIFQREFPLVWRDIDKDIELNSLG